MRAKSREVAIEAVIGARIRELRTARGITLAQLAGQLQATKGLLSKIENGRVSSPVSTLTRVATALGVEVGALFQTNHAPQPAVLVKAHQRRVIVGRGTKLGHTYESLAFGVPLEKAFEPYLMTIDARRLDPRRNVFRHPGHELLFMLSGWMDYRHDHQTYHLDPGDSLFFDATYPHGPVAIAPPPVRFLSIISNPLLHR